MDISDDMKNKRVLITGGLGFIGSNLAHRLVTAGAQVTLVDSLIPEYGGNLFNIAGIEDKVRINISDVRDVHSMRYLVREQDYLFNLAGQTSHLDSMQDPYTDLEINCRAQLAILETCRHYNPGIKIVFASTRQIYGKADYLPVDEKHLLRPVDVNGINKMAGEWYYILYNNVYNIRGCALRLTNTYGPHMRVKDARQTFVGIWIRNLLEGNPIKIFGDGSQVRDFNYVDDVLEAMMMCACSEASNGHVFNTGGAQTVSLLQLAMSLIEANGGKGEYKIVPFPEDRKAIDIGDYYSDYSLLQQKIGWAPKISLTEGLVTTLEYYRRNLQYYV